MPLPSLLPSIFPSIRVFPSELSLHIRWPKYWSISFSINPFNEYSRLISFQIDWFDLPEIQGTLKSLLQHHSSKVSVLQCSAFFTVLLYEQVKKQQLKLDMEQWTGSKLGKKYIKAVYCHPAYRTYMQSTSCEMLGWMKHKLESRFLGWGHYE